MANRFLDSNYYKSPFVRALKGPLKALYSFIICDCDGAGIWNLDLQAASMYTGFPVTAQEFEENFTAKGKAINLGGDKFFFPDFIEHQYPSGLQANNKAHKNFISTLKKFDLIDENLKLKVDRLRSPFKAPLEASQVQSRPMSSNGNGIGQGNGIGHVGEVTYNAEETISKNQKELERICISTGKDLGYARDSLRKYHLHLEEKEQYPKGRKAVFAGFEKWLMNEKKMINGTTLVKSHGEKPVAKINPSGGFGKL